MKIGIAAATYFEIQPTINYLQENKYFVGSNDFEILVTGIGSMIATYKLTTFLHKQRPQLVIQAGIGGSFTDQFGLGDVAVVKQDVMGDLGVFENEQFRDLFDMGFMEKALYPFNNGALINPQVPATGSFGLPAANGVTVNEITTAPGRIAMLRSKYQCDIESMEGAALHYVCLREDVPFLQLRAVSNQVGVRDKTAWKVPRAIENLNKKLSDIIQNIP